MATSEHSGPATGRPKHTIIPEEAEENDLIYKFIKMIETFRKEIKKSP